MHSKRQILLGTCNILSESLFDTNNRTAKLISTCQVENQLFRVARHLFVNTSEVFSTMFSLPQDNVGVVDGSDDEHPLVLQGVESADFENILEALVAQQ